MDGGSSSLPLPPPPPPPPVYLRRPMPPPDPAPPHKVRFAPIPIFTARGPGSRNATRPPVAPPAPAATPRPQQPPPPAAPTADQQLPPTRPPLAAAAAAAMPPPRLPQPPSAAAEMLPPPTPQAVAMGQQQTATAPSNNENDGIEISRAEINKDKAVQGHDKARTTAPVKIKRPKSLKPSKPTLDASNGGTIEGEGGSLYSSNHCRYDSSLSLLTKKFVSLFEEAEDGTIDLNKAAESLEVQKRRIYDITNVLEGVDLIEKTLKNMIRWKGFDISKPKEKEHQTSALKEELESLYEEDDRLENEIRKAQEKLEDLTLDEDKRKLLYVLKDDINNIPHFKGQTLIAINAPRGTSIEVPDPDADFYLFGKLKSTEKHYRMVLRSSMGPIDCYLISDRQETFNPSCHQPMPENLESVVATGSARALHHVDSDPDQSVGQMDCDPNEAVQKMDCDPNEPVQQMDCDQSHALKKGESNAACIHTDAPSGMHESQPDILKIIPSEPDADADYWFASGLDVSVTDTWGT